MEHSDSGDTPKPNIVLLDGPYKGSHLAGNPLETLAIGVPGGPYFVYRPTGTTDATESTLAVYAIDR